MVLVAVVALPAQWRQETGWDALGLWQAIQSGRPPAGCPRSPAPSLWPSVQQALQQRSNPATPPDTPSAHSYSPAVSPYPPPRPHGQSPADTPARQPQRHGSVLLNQQDRDALTVDLAQRARQQQLAHHQWRQADARHPHQQQLRPRARPLGSAARRPTSCRPPGGAARPG